MVFTHPQIDCGDFPMFFGAFSESNGPSEAMQDLEEEFSAAVGAFSLTGPILSFTLATISIASGGAHVVTLGMEPPPKK